MIAVHFSTFGYPNAYVRGPRDLYSQLVDIAPDAFRNVLRDFNRSLYNQTPFMLRREHFDDAALAETAQIFGGGN